MTLRRDSVWRRKRRRFSPFAWLVGFRVVEKGDDYRVLRCPLWVTESAIQRAAANVRKDVLVAGKDWKITVGHRLIRVEGEGVNDA